MINGGMTPSVGHFDNLYIVEIVAMREFAFLREIIETISRSVFKNPLRTWPQFSNL